MNIKQAERLMLRVADLRPNEGQIDGVPANPRYISESDYKALCNSLREDDLTGILQMKVYDNAGEWVVLDGNMRLRALNDVGVQEVECIVVPQGIPAKKLRKIVALSNSTFGEWDMDMLANEWDADELSDWGLNIPGFDEQPSEQQDAQEDDFDEEKDKVETVCKKGDIWLLGQHRLMCGSCTDPDAMDKLMDGNKADVAFTSPPYGVTDGTLRQHKVKGQHTDNRYANFYEEHDDNMDTWPALIEESYQQLAKHSIYQFINIQMLADNKRELMQWAARHSDCLCDIIIWYKTGAAPQMQPNILNNRMEFIYIFGGDYSRKLRFGNFHGTETTVIDDVKLEANAYSKIHKAVFPVALPARIIKLNEKATTFLDTFGGTGTTMIACEQLGRKCYMMELDPHYCDVIIARWEKLTGQKATRL